MSRRAFCIIANGHNIRANAGRSCAPPLARYAVDLTHPPRDRRDVGPGEVSDTEPPRRRRELSLDGASGRGGVPLNSAVAISCSPDSAFAYRSSCRKGRLIHGAARPEVTMSESESCQARIMSLFRARSFLFGTIVFHSCPIMVCPTDWLARSRVSWSLVGRQAWVCVVHDTALRTTGRTNILSDACRPLRVFVPYLTSRGGEGDRRYGRCRRTFPIAIGLVSRRAASLHERPQNILRHAASRAVPAERLRRAGWQPVASLIKPLTSRSSHHAGGVGGGAAPLAFFRLHRGFPDLFISSYAPACCSAY